MTKEEFSVSMAYLGLAYGKEYTEQELSVYYDFLKEYSDETLMRSIKSIIKESKFPPKINEMVEVCEKHKEQIKYDILEFMHNKGYFKCSNEYDKAAQFLKRNIIPDWLRKDMNKYYKMMNQDLLSTRNINMIGN